MKYSIIIPVYNKANTITETVKSVLAQTTDDYEIIIIDDGSTDDLIYKIPDNSHIRVIRQENRGVSIARNKGIENAVGEFVCFLDADDLWENNHLETLDSLINEYPEYSYFVTSHCVKINEDAIIHCSNFLNGYDEHFICDDFIGLLNSTSYSVVHTNSVCIRRNVLIKERIWFEPGIGIGEDSDVWYRVALKYSAVVSKKETTMYQREYSTATKKTFFVENWIFSLREKEILASTSIARDRKQSAMELIERYYLTGSREYMLNGDRRKAKEYLKKVKNKCNRRYIYTSLFSYLPYFLCRLIYKKKI